VSAWLQQAALWSWQNSLAAGALAVLVLGLRRAGRGRIAPRWLCLAGWLVMLRLLLPAPLAHPWAWDRAWAAESAAAPPVLPPLENFTPPPRDLREEIAATSTTLESLPTSSLTALADSYNKGGASRNENAGSDGAAAASPHEEKASRHEGTLPAAPLVVAENAPASAPAVVIPASPAVMDGKPAAVNWPLVAAWLWAGGAVIFLSLAFLRHARFMRRLVALAHSLQMDDGGRETRATLAECARHAGLRRLPELLTVPGGGSPFLCGLWSPRIVLPADTLAALSRNELRHVLLHEMLHIARRDLAANWLLAFLRALHWWNPLIHISARRLLADRELLRDQQAIALLRDPAERAAYGHTLLKLALPQTAPALSPGLAPFFRTEKELHRRLTMLQSPLHRPRLAATAAALTLTAIAAPVFSTARGQEEKKEAVEAVSSATSTAGSEPLLNRFQFLPAYATTPSGTDAEKEEGLIQFSGRGKISLEPLTGKAIPTLDSADSGRTPATGGATNAPNWTGGTPISNAAWIAADLDALRSRLRVLQSVEGQQLVAVMYALGEGNEHFTRLCNQSRDENGQLAVSLLGGFGPKHPKTIGLKAAIAVKNEQLEKLAQQYVEALEIQLKGAEAVERDAGRAIQTPQGIIVQFNAPGMSSAQANALEQAIHGIFQSPSAANTAASGTDEMQKLRADMAELKAHVTVLREAAGSYEQIIELQRLRFDLSRNEARGLGDKHPENQRLKARIAEIEQRISLSQPKQSAAAGDATVHANRITAWSTTQEEASRIAETLRQEFKDYRAGNQPAAPVAAPRAESVKPTDQASDNLPWGVAVPGRKDHVFTPYSPDSAVVDVTGFKKGDKVKCPHTGNFFRVP